MAEGDDEIEEYSWAELAEEAGISARTLRKYQQYGLVSGRPPYTYLTLARVAAIGYLRLERGMKSLAAIKAFLAGMTDQQVYDMVAITDGGDGSSQTAAVTGGSSAAGTRVQLVPGLELHLAADASVEARQLAAEIEAWTKKGA